MKETDSGAVLHKTYTTVAGDMWDQISFDQLGSEAYRNAIMELNPAHVGKYVFSAGVELKLPEAQPDVDAGLPPWKRSQP